MAENVIRELREERDVPLRKLARAIGMDAGHLSRLERGLASCSWEYMAAIAQYFDLPIEYVFPYPEKRDSRR